MNYKDYLKARALIARKYGKEREEIQSRIDKARKQLDKGTITKRDFDEKERIANRVLDEIAEREGRSIDRLKMHYAAQDAPAKVNDIIWAGTKCMKVERIKLAAFDYPMLKYYGTLLTNQGLPRKQNADGHIYQKDIKSVNGVAYVYKVKE